MTKTRRGLFCTWIRTEYPEVYEYAESQYQGLGSKTDRYITETEAMVYRISKAVYYPHTPSPEIFFGKSKKKQKKYIRALAEYIKNQPEVTTFCVL
jgi:hypothetical protein